METEICKREGKENKIYINEFSKVIFLNNGIRFLFRSTFFFKRHICWIKEGLQSKFDYQLNCALCDVIWPMRNSFKVHLLGSLWLKHCAMPTSKNEEKLSYSTPEIAVLTAKAWKSTYLKGFLLLKTDSNIFHPHQFAITVTTGRKRKKRRIFRLQLAWIVIRMPL